MQEIVFIAVVTWIGFDAKLQDIPVQYYNGTVFEDRQACENQLKNTFAGKDGYKLEVIKNTRNEIVLRVVSGTRSYNTFVTCLEVEKF